MVDVQGVQGGDDRPTLRDLKKGKSPAPKPKKKKVKKGGPDDWETTLAVDGAHRQIEHGGRGAQFWIVDSAGSLTTPEGPPQSQPC